MFDGGVVVLDTFGTPVASYPEDTDGSFEDWTSLQVSQEQVNAFLLGLVRSDRPVISNILGGGTSDDLANGHRLPRLRDEYHRTDVCRRHVARSRSCRPDQACLQR